MSDTKEYENGLTVLALQGENVKRVRAVKIVPPRVGVVKVAGKNGAGKSSVLDLIQLALGGGKAQPTLPIRQGATKASDVLDLQDASGKPVLRVTRKWTGKDSYLSVERIGGGRITGPQEFLDALVGAGLGFDPLAFMRLRPAQQIVRLLEALKLPEDPMKIDLDKSEIMAARAAVTRDARALTARIEALPDAASSTPDAEVSVTTLLAERDELQAQRGRRSDAERAARQRLDQQGGAEQDVERAQRLVATAEKTLEAARQDLTVSVRTLAAVRENAERAVAEAQALPDPDLTDITARIADAETVNQRVRQKLAKRQLAETLAAKTREIEAFTEYIERLDEKKRALLLGATFPVPGLGFEIVAGDYTPTLAGVPLDQVAQSEQIRVGVALAMALTPTVRVILVRDGSLLDVDTLAEIERLAGERGYQVWTEIVGKPDGEAFIIEDGEVLAAPKSS